MHRPSRPSQRVAPGFRWGVTGEADRAAGTLHAGTAGGVAAVFQVLERLPSSRAAGMGFALDDVGNLG